MRLCYCSRPGTEVDSPAARAYGRSEGGMGSGGERGQFCGVFLELCLRTSLFRRGGGNVTVPTDHHKTYGLSPNLRSWASLSGD
jgi:hypothetical protein